MKFDLQSGHFEKKKADSLVIPVLETPKQTQVFEKINKISKGALQETLTLLKTETDFQGKIGQTYLLHRLTPWQKTQILLVGCGKKTQLSARDYRKIITQSTKHLKNTHAKTVFCFLTALKVDTYPLAWHMKQAVECINDALYSFDTFKSEKNKPNALKAVTFYLEDSKQHKACLKAIQEGLATAAGVNLTKDLANLPPNICTPTYLAAQAKKLSKAYAAIKVKTLNKKAIKHYGMGAYAAVTQGSHQEAQLICIDYHPNKSKLQPIVLVGKGVTFDTGGTNVKPVDGMYGMKYDMCGAATVLGVIKAIAELRLPLRVIGLAACVENMAGGAAMKPEDIVTTLSGKTIEIMNTDAEGRLVLCDTLTYAEQFKPATVIDIATLTGSVVMALGTHATGLLSNDQDTANALLKAGIESHDRAWQMPLWEEYQDQIKSTFADISNTGGRGAGVITAACFLSRFTEKFKWAHLDIAGTTANMGSGAGERMATGRPVPLLTQYLIHKSQKSYAKN